MALLLRIVSVFIFSIACVAMLFSAFLSSPAQDSQSFIVDFFQDYIPEESENFNYKYISERESYYSELDLDSHVVEELSNDFTLILSENDRILTSLYHPLKNYTVSGKGFNLKQIGIGEVYIDMLSRQNRYFIQPLTTSIELSFTSDDGGEIYNSIYLFPGQYIVFDPARNSFFTNADIARMQILTDIGYISEQNLPPERLQAFIGEDSIYHIYLENHQEKQLYYQSKSQELSELEISNLSSVSRIERYFLIFLNPEKKRIYYQNRIIESYLSLVRLGTVDRAKLAEVSRYLSLLRDINPEAYNESYQTILKFNSLMFRNTLPQNIASNVSLSLIENNSNTLQDLLFFTFYTYTSSRITQITNEDEQLIRNYIASFLKYYDNNKTAKQYFSYLLQEKTLELLANPSNVSYTSILLYLGEYIRISQGSFIDSELEKKSLLYIYQNLIELLEVYLRRTFFQDGRTETNLLILRREVSLSSGEFMILRQQVGSLLAHYASNTRLLDDRVLRDVSLKASILEKTVLLREYLAALANYEAYTLEFDKVSQELLDRGRGDLIDQIITNEGVMAYLSRFQGLGLANLGINIGENGVVRVEGISVSGRSLAFTLLPLAGNRIRDIVLDGNRLIFEYPLDSIEFDWEEKMRTAREEEKDMFDFRRFFLITLIEDRRDVGRDIITDNVSSNQEDTVIAVFKREVLLSQNGEFSELRDVMQFAYNDIAVTRRDDTFDIFLNGVGLILQLRESRNNITYNGFFSSEYILTDDTRSFKDMRIQIYEDIQRSERTVFGNNRLHIPGEVPFSEMRDVLADITDNLANIFSIVNILNNEGITGEISMQYSPNDKKLRIRFDFGGERHSIVYASSRIESYIRGRERVIIEPIPVFELSDYLK